MRRPRPEAIQRAPQRRGPSGLVQERAELDSRAVLAAERQPGRRVLDGWKHRPLGIAPPSGFSAQWVNPVQLAPLVMLKTRVELVQGAIHGREVRVELQPTLGKVLGRWMAPKSGRANHEKRHAEDGEARRALTHRNGPGPLCSHPRGRQPILRRTRWQRPTSTSVPATLPTTPTG